ncbi:hypothetical protein AWN76_001570 [Rhodothermaceae bacterium RA]|nr:hypothetical protein AWN76_001570 [Rhodothermaceae bacterium RA]
MLRTTLLLLLLATVLPARAQDEAPFLETTALFPLTEDHVHGSTIAELPNGDLLAAWFQGSGERWADDVAILGARRPAGAASWSEPFTLADTPGFPDINPVLFVDPDGQLWLFWYTVLANLWETSLLKVRTSTDYGRNGPPVWHRQDVIHVKPGGSTERGIQPDDPFVASVAAQLERYTAYLTEQGFFDAPGLWARWIDRTAEILADAGGEDLQRRGRRYRPDGSYENADMGYPLARRLGWQTRNKPVALPGGRLILPLYSDRFSFSLMALTDDGGQTWSFSTPLVGAGNVQPAIARRTDGTLVAYMRDNGPPPQRLHVSTSTDDGATWSDVRDSDHVNSGTAADVVVLANGHWAMVNNDTETGRYRLTVSISPDEGRTWPWSRALADDDRGNEATRSHYPAIIQSRDGLLHVIYSVHHEDRSGPRKTIHHARFNEAWVRGEG